MVSLNENKKLSAKSEIDIPGCFVNPLTASIATLLNYNNRHSFEHLFKFWEIKSENILQELINDFSKNVFQVEIH